MRNFCFALCIALVVCINQAFGSESGMPQLNTEYWTAQIFWLTLIFTSLYLIVWKIFLPRITYSIENRKSRIVNDLDDAEKLKESAEKKLEGYNLIIEQSKKEAKKIIEDSKRKLNQDLDNKKKKFNDEIEKELEVAAEEIEDRVLACEELTFECHVLRGKGLYNDWAPSEAHIKLNKEYIKVWKT